MRDIARSLCTYVTLATFLLSVVPGSARAEGGTVTNGRGGSFTLTPDMSESRASEYVMRRFPGEHLIPVRILSGVKNPGTYYLPEGTDLITAVALSGGLTTTADPEKIHWNQWSSQKVAMIDMNEAVAQPQKGSNPHLGPNDVLMVEETKPWISNNTVLLITVLTGVLTAIISAKALTK